MRGSHCKLYDENLVRNIMVSTGLSIFEYLKNNRNAKAEEVCDFVENNVESIIFNTIEDMNDTDDNIEGDEDEFKS